MRRHLLAGWCCGAIMCAVLLLVNFEEAQFVAMRSSVSGFSLRHPPRNPRTLRKTVVRDDVRFVFVAGLEVQPPRKRVVLALGTRCCVHRPQTVGWSEWCRPSIPPRDPKAARACVGHRGRGITSSARC